MFTFISITSSTHKVPLVVSGPNTALHLPLGDPDPERMGVRVDPEVMSRRAKYTNICVGISVGFRSKIPFSLYSLTTIS